ncbi:MAG TPA: hypothetical protein VN397_00460 [Candidatus Methylomirabilis sp.]|nr:hypothetical protein [Candidatus Methylomirabilis sp.]
MSGLNRLTIDELYAFMRALDRSGVTPDVIRSVAADETLAVSMVLGYEQERVRRAEELRFHRMLFTPPVYQLKTVRMWNVERNWGFTDEQFRAAASVIPSVPDRYLVGAVLIPHLGTVQRTHDELWAMAASRHPQSDLWDRFEPDSQEIDGETRHFGVELASGQEHAPGLRWEVIDFGSHVGKAVTDMAGRPLPHAGILAAAALHPEWVAYMDGNRVPFVWLSGYVVTGDSSDAFGNVPTLSLEPYAGKPMLRRMHDDGRKGKPTYAVPTFHRTI